MLCVGVTLEGSFAIVVSSEQMSPPPVPATVANTECTSKGNEKIE